MAFVFAFLIGGSICALGQLVVEAKVPVPVALVAFMIIGAILSPLGIMDKLLALGPGGV
jgi:stage V sporulation protein AE